MGGVSFIDVVGGARFPRSFLIVGLAIVSDFPLTGQFWPCTRSNKKFVQYVNKLLHRVYLFYKIDTSTRFFLLLKIK